MKNDKGNRIKWVADPATYLHLIKMNCVVCERPIEPKNYEDNGNF